SREMADSAAIRFLKIVRLIRFCAAICGTDVSNPNYRMWALSYAIIGIIFIFYGFTFYTIYVGVVVENDWTVILQVLGLAGSAVHGMFKMMCCVTHARRIREVQGNYESIYMEYELKGGEYTKCLHECINTFWKFSVAVMCFYSLVGGGLIVYPLYYTLVYKEKILVLQFLVPFIDHTTDRGYLLLTELHSVCVIFASFGNFAGDMYFFLFITNVPLIKNIFKVKLKEFNEFAKRRDQYDNMHSMLGELLALHQQYVRILRATENIFNFVMFVELSTPCISILCSISCIFLQVWATAPLYMVYCFVLLYAFCGLGTLVESSVRLANRNNYSTSLLDFLLQNEDFMDAVYSDCLWYELPVKEQKLIILMLAKAQSEHALTAMDVLPMSMATALQLTKGVYSFSMMLITYLG
ncbi:hypothetical protein KR222_005886, partial [Zaprionus bogoriensis]